MKEVGATKLVFGGWGPGLSVVCPRSYRVTVASSFMMDWMHLVARLDGFLCCRGACMRVYSWLLFLWEPSNTRTVTSVPAFVGHVIKGCTIEALVAHCCSRWVPPFSPLSHFLPFFPHTFFLVNLHLALIPTFSASLRFTDDSTMGADKTSLHPHIPSLSMTQSL